MRLWQKVFLATLALFFGIACSMSVVYLKRSSDLMWKREGEHAVTETAYIAGNISYVLTNARLKEGKLVYEENESGYAPTHFGITKDAVWEVLELLGDDEHKRIALPYLFLDELRVYATPYRLGIIANVYPGKNEVVANIGEPELSNQIYSIYTGLLEYATDRSFAKIRKESIL